MPDAPDAGPAVRGSRFLELVAVMDRLRSPGGCPWDAEQTHASLVKYLLEESYETAEAIEDGDDVALREELGDVLLQVVFHSRIAQERSTLSGEPWDIDDVAGGIVDKLVSRHPHVFDPSADAALSAGDVQANWEVIKAIEKGRTSALDGVPLAQPALALASAVIGRTAKAGLDVPVATSVVAPAVVDADSVGDLLLSVVALARSGGVDPEAALRQAVRRYRADVVAAEAAVAGAAASQPDADASSG